VEHFLDCVATRRTPLVSGKDGLRALDAALAILAKIEEHKQVVVSQLKSLP
jgi:predicted dehydrogenase